MSKKHLKTAFLLLCVVCIPLLLTGCRQSMVIARILHDQKAEEKEKDQFIVRNEEDVDEKDDTLPQLEEDESERRNDQKKLATVRGNQSNPGQASRTTHSDDSSNNTKADRSGRGAGPRKNRKKPKGSGGNGGGGQPDNTDDGQGDKRQIYDDDGNVIDLPEEVNAVVAPGEAGLIVQMLGGQDILTGTSASILSDGLAMAVFADEGIEKAMNYWDGDGSAPMSTENFSVLVESKPDVCIAVGGMGSFSEIALSMTPLFLIRLAVGMLQPKVSAIPLIP